MNICVNSGMLDDEKAMWLPFSSANGLFKLDNNKLKYITSFSDVIDDEWEIEQVVSYDKNMFYFSKRKYVVWKYDRKTNELVKIIFSNKNPIFITSCIVDKEKVWIFPKEFDCPIIKFNLDTLSAVEVPWNVINIESKELYSMEELIGTSITKSVYHEGKIFIANRNRENIVLIVLDCENNSMIGIRIEDAVRINCLGIENGWIRILYYSKNKKSIFLKANLENSMEQISIDITEKARLLDGPEMKYLRMICVEKYSYIFPKRKDNVLVINEEKGICEYLYDLDDNIKQIACYNLQWLLDKKQILIFSSENKDIHFMEFNENGRIKEIKEIDLYIEEQESKKLLRKLFTQKYLINESYNISCEDYISGLSD